MVLGGIRRLKPPWDVTIVALLLVWLILFLKVEKKK
jgi:hypothetical protein